MTPEQFDTLMIGITNIEKLLMCLMISSTTTDFGEDYKHQLRVALNTLNDTTDKDKYDVDLDIRAYGTLEVIK